MARKPRHPPGTTSPLNPHTGTSPRHQPHPNGPAAPLRTPTTQPHTPSLVDQERPLLLLPTGTMPSRNTLLLRPQRRRTNPTQTQRPSTPSAKRHSSTNRSRHPRSRPRYTHPPSPRPDTNAPLPLPRRPTNAAATSNGPGAPPPNSEPSSARSHASGAGRAQPPCPTKTPTTTSTEESAHTAPRRSEQEPARARPKDHNLQQNDQSNPPYPRNGQPPRPRHDHPPVVGSPLRAHLPRQTPLQRRLNPRARHPSRSPRVRSHPRRVRKRSTHSRR